MPVLEQKSKKALKVCFQDRDFNVGRPLQDNIIDAIEQSSKVIAIISPDAPSEEWFHYSFNLAVREGKRRGDSRFIIPVLTDNLDLTLFHHVQQKYLKTAYKLH